MIVRWFGPSTALAKRYLNARGGIKGKAGGSKKPLIGETGRLSSEIHYRATDTQLQVGSPLIYAAVQQFGAEKGAFGKSKHNHPIPWGDIPARPFLGLSYNDREAIIATLKEHVTRSLR
jgi:phage gpG-like protein